MFNVIKTQHVLAVDDIALCQAYFIDKLGFELRKHIDGWSFLSLGDFHVMMGDCQGEVPASETGNHSWFAYVNCTAIDDLYNDMQQRGAMITEKLANKPWGLREFLVTTPEGHRIKFGQEL
jgi:catechol-2,3-dioxygenase